MRESAHDLTAHEFHITDHGIEVASDAQSAHAILSNNVSIVTRGQLSSKRSRK
jgi:KaiC/GvpD/RAD55 family RecA-like ATPase